MSTRKVSRIKTLLVLLIFGLVCQNCTSEAIDPKLEFWGVWNPGKGSTGPFRNIRTNMGLFKSPSGDPIIFDKDEPNGPTILQIDRVLVVKAVEGRYPDYTLTVEGKVFGKPAKGKVQVHFDQSNTIRVSTSTGLPPFESTTGDLYFTRAEKLERPISEEEYNSGS